MTKTRIVIEMNKAKRYEFIRHQSETLMQVTVGN